MLHVVQHVWQQWGSSGAVVGGRPGLEAGVCTCWRPSRCGRRFTSKHEACRHSMGLVTFFGESKTFTCCMRHDGAFATEALACVAAILINDICVRCLVTCTVR